MNGAVFSGDELIRYSRHFVLPGFGEAGQTALKKSSVLVVGAGGLGAPALYYLTAAGVGRIGIADADTVNLSNLQRQILFTVEDIGAAKAKAAAKRLQSLNPDVRFDVIESRLEASNVMQHLEPYKVIVDATDNFPTRYLLNDACVLAGKPLIYGSVFRYEGQVSVFNYREGPNYRDLFPAPPEPGTVPDCEQGGVLGVLPGLIGAMQASEAIKVLTGIGDVLSGRLWMMDMQHPEPQVIAIPDRRARDRIKNLIDYDEFCGLKSKEKHTRTMKEITVQELKKMIDSKTDFQLIDVREPYEFDICNLEGELIPMADVPANADKISKEKQVVVHCRSGRRSGDIIQWLEKNKGFTNLYNLKGGILAWSDQIDPSMPKY